MSQVVIQYYWYFMGNMVPFSCYNVEVFSRCKTGYYIEYQLVKIVTIIMYQRMKFSHTIYF